MATMVGSPKSKRWASAKKHSSDSNSSSRNRKDSGFSDYFEEDCGGGGGGGGHHVQQQQQQQPSTDTVCQQWGEIINEWSSRAHSVISQESERMMAVAEIRRQEMLLLRHERSSAEVRRRWGEDMAAIMETTQDLLRCVAYDVAESISAPSSDTSSVTSHDLGRILEEKLKTKSDGGKKKKEIVKQAKEVEKRKKKSEDDNMEGWKKDGGSEVWAADKGSATATAEDIFCDWRATTLDAAQDQNRSEINGLFWSISMEERDSRRQRRISEVLDNLPFYDHPDVFGDRCELLEAPRQQQRRSRHGKRPTKCYWNIFNEWKHNLEVPKIEALKAKKKRRRNNKRPPRVHCKTWRMLKQTSLKHRFCGAKIGVDVLIAIDDSKHEPMVPMTVSSRRRSREELESDEDLQQQENHLAKRQKRTPGFETAQTWETVRQESTKALESLTKNIEEKIREAFRQGMEDQDCQEQQQEQQQQQLEDQQQQQAEEDEEDGEMLWPGLASKMKESWAEFSQLRDEVRRIRKNNHRRMSNELAFFQDWNWNLDSENCASVACEESQPEAVFAAWRHIFHDVMPKIVSLQKAPKVVTRGATIQTKVGPIIPRVPNAIVPNNKRSWNRLNQKKAAKTLKKLMSKCFARQPQPRGSQ